MPPRYAYWTILIDNKPTAFRAQKQEELLPTFKQLSRANPNIVMRWFARGRLWDSPEQARWAQANPPVRRETRGPTWRPGGDNKDPRARFARPKGGAPKRPHRPRGTESGTRPPGGRPFSSRPPGSRPPGPRDASRPPGRGRPPRRRG